MYVCSLYGHTRVITGGGGGEGNYRGICANIESVEYAREIEARGLHSSASSWNGLNCQTKPGGLIYPCARRPHGSRLCAIVVGLGCVIRLLPLAIYVFTKIRLCREFAQRTRMYLRNQLYVYK